MIIDCHGHFTTVPKSLHAWRKQQLEAASDTSRQPRKEDLNISDDELREAIENGQLKLQKERGGDMTIFSPTAGQMGHHLGNEGTSLVWSELCNNIIHRVCNLFPETLSVCVSFRSHPALRRPTAFPSCVGAWKSLGLSAAT